MRIPKVHIRDFLWATSVIGLGLAWCIDRRPLMAPRFAVRETMIDVGDVAEDEYGVSTFELRNGGRAPLRYVAGERSFHVNCADEGSILPGEAADFRVHWHARGRSGERIFFRVKLLTNDPMQKSRTLALTGRIK